ncbi:MAG: NAD(P)H-dependent oxidoreductase [Alphaproteobacteria bacterium]|nr:NAD(P)H-dependent oxidoreductase [Alphaproteobacteria bacterium]MBU1514749.1 NAD(P)H-dependent oxidoreductase [Alphaproteobacteria bacterium]MBU2093880.1 NAD(P)H-dependent oxidoreductase [Alphaproteobacteria bacterium]MBU2153307.1 NAD(P)H-dependent oxidoreductase [Alphaproteobacteria bacterium]MBU2309735.1 NAD(P)H-dependent oxidoreductase [Alphaproteobacteria bacterium]
MSQVRNVAVVIGSIRKDSVSRKLAKAFAAVTPGLKFNVVEIDDLPHFDQDLESDPPAQWTRFRNEIASADAVLFVTPEYNRSVPGVLKNAVDVGSRPYGSSVWNGKPGAVISVSPGAIGGFGANHHLRQSLVFLNVPLLSQEAYVGNAFALFDDNGELINDGTAEFLKSYGVQFAAWIEKIVHDVPAAKAA